MKFISEYIGMQYSEEKIMVTSPIVQFEVHSLCFMLKFTKILISALPVVVI